MRNHIRHLFIVAIILILSSLLLPGISATRKGIKPTAIDRSSSDHEPVRVGRFLIANLMAADDVSADLGVTKSASSEQVSAGTDLTYTIAVSNGGPEAADNATWSDTLPAGMTFVSLSGPAAWTCSTPAVGDGGIVTCTNLSLPAASDDVFTLVVHIPSETPPGTFFTNTATVSTDTPDPNDENNSYPAGTMVEASGGNPSGGGDVGVSKSASSEQVSAGTDLTYIIAVSNGGPEAADNVTWSDTLPGNMTFVSLSSTANWTCSTPAVGDGGIVTCSRASLAVTSGDVFTLVAHVPSGTPPGTIYTNTATVSTTSPDPNDENNSSTITTAVNYAISATAGTPQNALINTAFTTQLETTVTESGTPQSGIPVTFTAPGSGASGTFSGSGTTATVNTDSNGVATAPTFTANGLAGGPYNVTASLAGGTPSATFVLTNDKGTASITPGDLNQTYDGNPKSATATTNPPGLNVSLTYNGSPTPPTNVGTYRVVATVNDANYNGQATDTLTINKAATTTAVTSSVNPSDVGQSVTFTATVAPTAGTPTGMIQFKVDGTNADAPVALNATGVATFSTSSLSMGAHTITADYSGDANFTASTGTLTGGQAVDVQTSASINDVSVTAGNSGNTNAVFTVTLSQASNLTVKVDYATANGTATAGSDYQATSGTLTFAPGDLTKTITVLVNGETVNEPNETFTVNLTNPQNTTIGDAQGVATILNNDAPGMILSSSSYSVNEDAGHATITVTRTGDMSGAASVQYAASDLAGLVNCDVNTSTASARCDYMAVGGTLNFAAGQSSQTFTIPVINDVYVEGPETLTVTLSNPVGGALGSPNTAPVTITDDDDAAGAPNPSDNRAFLIRQLYLDFLNREPEPQGLQDWLAILNNCPAGGIHCDETEVSSDFFRSGESFERGYFIYRFYEVALGRHPLYDEYQRDLRRVTGFLTDAELEQHKQEFIADFMSRQEFRVRYDAKTDPLTYVAALDQTAGVSPSIEHQLILDLASGQKTRGEVLRAIVESPEASQKFYNKAFVVVGYFAYLRRDPDSAYLVWLNKLNTTGDYREMIRGFMMSHEYRSRFGPV